MTSLNSQQKTKAQMYLFGVSVLILSLVVGYIYFLSVSVIEVVARKEVDSKIVALYSELSELEAEYIQAQHSVSNEINLKRGFIKTSHKTFVDKRDSTLVLSGNAGF